MGESVDCIGKNASARRGITVAFGGRMRVVGISLFFGSAILACTTGSSTPGGGTGTHDGGAIVPSEAAMVQEGIICSTFYSSTGTFVPNTADPPPANFTGCWPIGAWTFSLSPNTNEDMGGGSDTCAAAGHEPTPLAMYQFTGTTTTDQNGDPEEQFTYTKQPDDPTVNTTIKVTEGGSGVCAGALALYDSTGTQVWSLSPELNADNSITGTAEYDLYGTDQWGGS
jgi:hypothetical protein